MARHSGATSATVRLGQTDDRVVLTVEDNGRGLKTDSTATRSFGIVGMRARARQIGGEVSVQNGAECGLRVRVWARLPEQTSDVTSKNTDHTR
jgi:signal transduction histidine kinase